MNATLEIFEDVSNPLDGLEEMLHSKDWVYDRLTNEELTLSISGDKGQYIMSFLWQEEYNVMQFLCECNTHIPRKRRDMTAQVLCRINEDMWLGHFDVPKKTGIPCFRHTSLFRGWTQSSGAEHIEDLVEIAVAFCERHHNVFQLLSNSHYLNDELLDLAMIESGGEA